MIINYKSGSITTFHLAWNDEGEPQGLLEVHVKGQSYLMYVYKSHKSTYWTAFYDGHKFPFTPHYW